MPAIAILYGILIRLFYKATMQSTGTWQLQEKNPVLYEALYGNTLRWVLYRMGLWCRSIRRYHRSTSGTD